MRQEQEEFKVSIQARCSPESLATIAKWLAENGSMPTSRSELIDKAIECFVQVIIGSGYEPVVSRENAFQLMQGMGIKWPTGTIGHKQLVKGLKLESLSLEHLQDVHVQNTGSSPEELRAQIEGLLKMQGGSD